jgi:uncharacterized membrane protein
MDDATIVMIVFLIAGVAEILQGIPLFLEKIKPNWLFGFRLPSTVKNKELWYKVNRYMGRGLIYAGIILVIGTLFVFIIDIGLSLFEKTMFLVILLAIPLSFVIIDGFIYLKKLNVK